MSELDFNTLLDKYNKAFLIIKEKFENLYEEYAIQYGENNPIEFINYRIKKQESIFQKLLRKSLPFTTENIENSINDIIGIRIVCSFLDDLEKVKDLIIKMEQYGELTIKNRKDYVSNPKDSGYSSYHMIVEIPVKIRDEEIKVKAEIQLRTIAMDVIASLEHKLRYKKDYNSKIYDDSLEKTLEICTIVDKELNDFFRANNVAKDKILFDRYFLDDDKKYKLMKFKYEKGLKIMKDKIDNIYDMYEKSGVVNPIEHIKYRLKDEKQIVRKLLLSGKEVNLANIIEYVNDFAGIRVVCSFKNDLENLKELIKSDPDLVIIKEKDYVNCPKESGYRGYHLIVGVPVFFASGLSYVKVEIQLRTIAMEMWASLEQKICYHKIATEDAKKELKRLSSIIEVIDDKIDSIVEKSHKVDYNGIADEVKPKVKVRKKEEN